MKTKSFVYLFLNLAVAFSCSNEVTPNDSIIQGSGSRLMFEKIKMADGTARIATEFQYNASGQLTSRISYNERGVVSTKQENFYEGDQLVRTTGMSDVSSSTTSTNYLYSYSTYEYDQGLLVKRNSFLKQGEAYEQRSYTIYTYNDSDLPIKESIFQTTGALARYTTYAYDQAGNISVVMDYDVVNNLGLTQETTYEYDAKKNPFKTVYAPLELIPYSVNSNNITKSVTINHVYPSNPSGDVGQSETSYKQYNSDGYPVLFSQNGVLDIILEYQ